jgi:hypothetical protein
VLLIFIRFACGFLCDHCNYAKPAALCCQLWRASGKVRCKAREYISFKFEGAVSHCGSNPNYACTREHILNSPADDVSLSLCIRITSPQRIILSCGIKTLLGRSYLRSILAQSAENSVFSFLHFAVATFQVYLFFTPGFIRLLERNVSKRRFY